MFSLQGKTVIVTGGGRGIGRGISRAVAKLGANVVISGRSASHLDETVEELKTYGAEAMALPGNIMSMSGINELIAKTQDKFGYIHGFINNAGSADPADVGPAININEEQWDNVVDLNLKWNFFAAQAAAKAMTGGGSILNITSRSGSQPCPNTSQYGAAKAGMENLTATLAVEWGHMGIRVNAIAPGVVLTERSSSAGNEKRQRRQIETIPMRRLGNVDDIGPLAAYYMADESEWITGTVVQATGGSRISVGVLSYLHKINQKMEEQEGVAAE
jgi:NAD(P)-dependent dehydrogenase (short-subunit alcohol dehydrogenase family)